MSRRMFDRSSVRLRGGRLLRGLALACVVVSTTSPGPLAQTIDPQAPPGVGGERAGVPLSLADSLRMALENNLNLRVIRRDPRIAEQNVLALDAAFDPEVFFGPTAQGFKSEPSRVFSAPGKGHTRGVTFGLRDRLRFGGGYEVSLDTSRSVGAGLLFEPSLDTQLSLTLDLPLLRGFGRETNEAEIILARTDVALSREELSRQAQVLLQDVEVTYWDLIGALEEIEVSQQSLRLAEDLLTLNRKKVEVGTLAPIEITQAEAGVASREEAAILAETAFENAEDRLRLLLGVSSSDPLWSQTIEPTLEPDFRPVSIQLETAIEQALQNRPEVEQARQQVVNRQLLERVAGRNTMHDLRLNASVNPSGNNLVRIDDSPGADGIFGTRDDFSVGKLGSGFESFQEVPELNNYGWQASLIYTIPIGNRLAKANYSIAGLEREKAEVNLQNLEHTIRIEVRNAAREVDSGAKRVAAARVNVGLQQKKLDAERKKFENGMSTSFEVLTFQTDLANAQLAEIRALIDYQKALAALERAKGTILEARGLRFEEGERR